MDDKKDIKDPAQEFMPKPVEAVPVVERAEVIAPKETEPLVDEAKELKAAMQALELDDSQKSSAAASVQDLKALKDVQEQVKKLLEMAKHKGVIYAIHVAKSMDDPYVVDALHDALVENGLYKQFLK